MKRLSITLAFVAAAALAGGLLMDSHFHNANADALAPMAPQAAPAVASTPAFLETNVYHTYSIVRGRPGFWRIAKTRDGVWWFLSPHNTTQFLNGVTTVQPDLRGRDPRGPDYVSHDWDGRSDQASLFNWAQATLGRVQGMGFKSLGAWCNPILHQFPVPMTQDLNISQWVPYDARLFSPDWQSSAEAAIREQAGSLRDNRNLVGYYIDNELDWDEQAVGPRIYFDQLPANDPNRREVCRVIEDIWPTVKSFNRDWNTTFHNWSELEHHAKLPVGSAPSYEVLQDRWLTHFATAYFRMTTGLIHKYDPNHLILGCRYRGWAPPQAPAGARGFTDVQSLNYYATDGLLDADTFRTISQQSDQPLIISEYTFQALDGRSGDRNLIHFPAQVSDQAERAAGYRRMTTRLARVPFVVGADWFQWMDEPPSGRRGDGEDANMGVVDVYDHPYDALAQAVRQTTPILNNLHAGSAADREQMVWRPTPAGQHATQLAGGADLLAK